MAADAAAHLTWLSETTPPAAAAVRFDDAEEHLTHAAAVAAAADLGEHCEQQGGAEPPGTAAAAAVCLTAAEAFAPDLAVRDAADAAYEPMLVQMLAAYSGKAGPLNAKEQPHEEVMGFPGEGEALACCLLRCPESNQHHIDWLAQDSGHNP